MKILFICENYLPHYGGAEVVFKNLAENYVKQGHEVTLLTHKLKGTKKQETISGVKVIRVNSFFSRYIFSFTSIIQAIKLAKASDIIQTTTFNGAPPAWLAGKLTKKPVVLTVHEIWQGRWNKVTNFSWLKTKMHEFLEKCIYVLPFEKYVCVSEATRKDLLAHGIQENKTVTIHNGMDYELWNPEKYNQQEVEEFRKNKNWQDNFVYFLWGRPGASKGFQYAIQAIPEIVKNVDSAKFVFMFGSKEKYDREYSKLFDLMKKIVRKNNLRNNIEILPSVPYQELSKHIKAADCVIVPSLAEGFGYSVVEANSMGTKVIASNAGSIPEVISGKHLLFQVKDSNDLAAKAILASQGKIKNTKLKKFLWKDSVEKYLQEYNKLIDRMKK